MNSKTLRDFLKALRLKLKSHKTIFHEKYKSNLWGDPQSLSGPGSNLLQTETIRKELPNIISELGITTFLDVPCGDFFWMKEVNHTGLQYTGGEIVEELVNANNAKYADGNRKFMVLDILSHEIPKVDVIFCRDCLVHFSNKHIATAIHNFKASGSKYLITTIFTDNKKNKSIATGQWQPLNLRLSPFNFPDPIKVITENCTQDNGIYADKSLAIWEISKLPDF